MSFKVSVVIPVYNAASFVSEAVASALAQPEVAEVLLVEDGSGDDSLEVCRQLADGSDLVQLLRHPSRSNLGAAASRNLGILKASQNFITFLDADDCYADQRFKRTKAVFEKYEDCNGVYEAIGMLPTDREHNKPWITTVLEEHAPEELFFRLSPIGNRGYFSLIGLTVRRDVFQKSGMLNESLRVSQDTDWMLRLAASCRLYPGEISKPVAQRRIHMGNRSTRESLLRDNRPAVALACLDWFVSHNMPAEHQSEVLRLYFKYRFEKMMAGFRGNKLARKYLDLRDGLHLWWRYPSLRDNPYLRYHLRLALKLPVDEHLNYYVGSRQ